LAHTQNTNAKHQPAFTDNEVKDQANHQEDKTDVRAVITTAIILRVFAISNSLFRLLDTAYPEARVGIITLKW
jgi:hypothetical protein